MGACSLLRFDLQSEMKEVSEDGRQRMLVLDTWCSVLSDQVQGSQRRLGEIRRFSFDHFDCHDAQAPDVDLSTIFFPRNHFRSHPIWSSHHRSALVVGVVDLCTEAKVGQLDVSSFRKQNVV